MEQLVTKPDAWCTLLVFILELKIIMFYDGYKAIALFSVIHTKHTNHVTSIITPRYVHQYTTH